MGRYDGEYIDDGSCDPAHPTGTVQGCSPDPVLTHDGKTSKACRRCRCGKYSYHEEGCKEGRGPKPTVWEERECSECMGSGKIKVRVYL